MSQFDIPGKFVWNAFFTEPGVPPYSEYNGKLVITSTAILVPAMNSAVKMTLRPVRFKDETIGQTSYSLQFEQSTFYTQQFSMGGSVDSRSSGGSSVQNVIMFTFEHFTRKITIRYKTVSEIWAEIGGLWAAATLVMALVFSQSGTTDPKNKKPSVIFNYIPSKMRKKWIEDNNVKLAVAKGQTIEDSVDVHKI